MNKTNNAYLRHTLATIAYRFQKSIQTANEDFGTFNLGKGSRTPIEIIRHIYDVVNAARIFIQTEKSPKGKPKILTWKKEIDRFSKELLAMDIVLTKQELKEEYSKKILQGPFSDILTHIGQISILSRLSGNPITGEDFSAAAIEPGTLSYFDNGKSR